MTPHIKGNFVEIQDLIINNSNTPKRDFRLILPDRVTYCIKDIGLPGLVCAPFIINAVAYCSLRVNRPTVILDGALVWHFIFG